jgi:hypothetical protein
MAGNVRQPIDIASLERYVAANVPEIQVPLDVKQVMSVFELVMRTWANGRVVWIWTE